MILTISAVGDDWVAVRVEVDCEFLEGISLSFAGLAPAEHFALCTVDFQ